MEIPNELITHEEATIWINPERDTTMITMRLNTLIRIIENLKTKEK